MKSKTHKVPAHLRKYYNKRYDLFARYDEGVVIKGDQWFSVSPEKVARQIALSCTEIYPEATEVIDGMGGAGGNAIQFALIEKFHSVVYIDILQENKSMADANSEVYGVNEKIKFLVMDFFDYRPEHVNKSIIVFISPPWGGVGYDKKSKDGSLWDITASSPSIVDIVTHTRTITPNIVLFLPRNTDLDQLEMLKSPGIDMMVDFLMLESHPVGICVYLMPQ